MSRWLLRRHNTATDSRAVAPVPACWLFKTSFRPMTFWHWQWCSESRVTWVTSLPISVFLGLSVLKLGPMYATDRRQRKASLIGCALWGRCITNEPVAELMTVKSSRTQEPAILNELPSIIIQLETVTCFVTCYFLEKHGRCRLAPA